MGVKIYSGIELEKVPLIIKADILDFKNVKEIIVPETAEDQADAFALTTAFMKTSITTHYVYKDRPVYITYN
ncbi:hypothetical protein M5X11_12270 [Paenibacillus alginolyticus]|uniref:hypothetical protein n=1 Tax=Paenibacillus alginolyticus TaxID=59839 RepID=UPI000FDB5878|nr:hypothetical protein [Paenibacillus alginolyticus]MCY9665730.1 hypothetical protein [Paenibacillus alginolyticus]